MNTLMGIWYILQFTSMSVFRIAQIKHNVQLDMPVSIYYVSAWKGMSLPHVMRFGHDNGALQDNG